jgi:hypothetical protein
MTEKRLIAEIDKIAIAAMRKRLHRESIPKITSKPKLRKPAF